MYIPGEGRALAAKKAPLEDLTKTTSPSTLEITYMPTRLENNDCHTTPHGCEVSKGTDNSKSGEDMRANGDINLGMRGLNEEDKFGIVVIVIIAIVGVGLWIAYGNSKGPRTKIRTWWRNAKTKMAWRNRSDERTLAGSPPDPLASAMSSAVTLTDKEVTEIGRVLVGNMHQDGRAQSQAGSSTAAASQSSSPNSSSPRSPDMLTVSPHPIHHGSSSPSPSPRIRREDSSLRNLPAVIAMRQQEGDGRPQARF